MSDLPRLAQRFMDRAESIEKASDGGGKGCQCVDCGEWNREHKPHCDVMLFRQTASALAEADALRGALKASTDALRWLVVNSDTCGDPDAECPMHDAGKSWHEVQIALKAADALLAPPDATPRASTGEKE